MLLLFYVLAFWPQGIWDLNLPTRDQTHTPWAGGLSLDHWTTREILLFKNLTSLITHVFFFSFLTQKVVIVVLA